MTTNPSPISKEALVELDDYDFLLPDSPDYEASLQRWFSSSIRPAGVVFFPRSVDDAAFATRWATKHGVELVVRGGGHSVSGASSTNGGIVLDLSRHLNTVRIDPEKKIAFVGGGCVWRQVDSEAIKYGLATPSGVYNDTGVGGLATGGGIGFLTGLCGLACDNIIGGTIVLPSGIVIGSLQENKELLWAIRGAGAGAFGCITEFIIQLHSLPRTVSAGIGFYTPEQVPELIPKIEKFLKVRTAKDTGGFILVIPESKPAVVWLGVHIGPKAEAEPIFHDILSVASKTVFPDLIAEIPFEKMNELMHPFMGRHQHGYASSAFHSGPPGEVIQKSFDNWMAVVSSRNPSVVPGLDLEIIFHHWEKASQIKDSVWTQRDPNQFFLASLATYNPSAGADGLATASAIATQVREVFVSANGEAGGGYPNFDGALAPILAGEAAVANGDGHSNSHANDKLALRDRRAVEIVGSENLERLRRIKRAVDPEGVFRSWFGA